MNPKRNFLQIAALSFLLLTLSALPAFAAKAPEIPAGTVIKVRMIDNLTSEKARVGDTFRGTLEEAIVVNGRQLYPKGADVSGRVLNAHPSGRLSDPGELQLVLTTVTSGRQVSSLTVEPFEIKGASHTKSNVGKIGGGAAIGAIIGGLAGGGKGAAIGAGVGAAAGTGAAAATGKREATVESEAVLIWTTTEASTGMSGRRPAAEDERDSEDAEEDTAAFSPRDRRVIRDCLYDHASELPPGLAKRDRLPPGLERQLRRNGTLPPGLQKRVHSLPLACEDRLPRLPHDWERVIYGGRVLLINSAYRILDLFLLDAEE